MIHDISLDNNEIIYSLKNNYHYKYLGICESDKIQNNEIKEETSKEYKFRLRMILRSNLNSKYIIKAINTWK